MRYSLDPKNRKKRGSMKILFKIFLSVVLACPFWAFADTVYYPEISAHNMVLDYSEDDQGYLIPTISPVQSLIASLCFNTLTFIVILCTNKRYMNLWSKRLNALDKKIDDFHNQCTKPGTMNPPDRPYDFYRGGFWKEEVVNKYSDSVLEQKQREAGLCVETLTGQVQQL